MNLSVVCPAKHDFAKPLRWAVLILPIFFCGCFDTQSTRHSVQGKEIGISSIGRFFMHARDDSSQKPAEAAIDQVPATYSSGITVIPELAEDVSENRVALPTFISAGQSSLNNSSRTGNIARGSSDRSQREQASRFRSAASLVFNAPFNQIFSKIFKQSKNDEPTQESAQIVKDEMPNPFTEARLKQGSPPAEEASNAKTDVTENKADSTKQTVVKETKSDDSPKAISSDPTTSAVASTGISANGDFLIVGDFDGTGTLRVMPAQRSTDTHFISEDGERDFNLRINSAAVKYERSFYIDDINSDGIPDILITSSSSLFGGVFLGDGAGGYKLAYTFPTGYEPTVPCAGPVRNGMREILGFNMYTGRLRTFTFTDKYHLLQMEKSGFVPDYLLHLIAPDTRSEFVMAAQTGGAEQIMNWNDDGYLESTADQLGADATAWIYDFGSNSLRAYQVGNYASIVLSSQGKSFNVANMRVLPRSYLVIGDLQKRGSLDVAVADLLSFTPLPNNR